MLVWLFVHGSAVATLQHVDPTSLRIPRVHREDDATVVREPGRLVEVRFVLRVHSEHPADCTAVRGYLSLPHVKQAILDAGAEGVTIPSSEIG